CRLRPTDRRQRRRRGGDAVLSEQEAGGRVLCVFTGHDFGEITAKPRAERSDSRESNPQESLRSSWGLKGTTMNVSEYKIKEQICEIGRRLYNKGFAAANDGNITVRLNDKEILCTPTMVSKGFMKPDDICKVDYEGKQLAGSKRRTSEVLLHLAVYKNRPDVNAVVHCHPPHATAFAVAHEPIPKCILPEVEVFLGEVPIAKYATPGDQRLPNTIVPYVKDCNTILLANHGTVSWGPTVELAYFNTEIIDAYCRILLLAKQLGRIHYFTEQDNAELMEV